MKWIQAGEVTGWGMAFPACGRGITAIATKELAMGGQIDIHVQIGGVPVNPAPMVVADSSAILMLSPEMAAASWTRARRARREGPGLRLSFFKGPRFRS